MSHGRGCRGSNINVDNLHAVGEGVSVNEDIHFHPAYLRSYPACCWRLEGGVRGHELGREDIGYLGAIDRILRQAEREMGLYQL